MYFDLQQVEVDVSSFPERHETAMRWEWYLREGTPDKPGSYLARSPVKLLDESMARSDIAAFRKKAGGVKFAKVVSP